MAADSLRARHPKRRINIISLRKVYRSVWNHPLVVVVLLFLICLHQYFPSAFALVVSVSPIIICTAVLLGAILVHGQPNDHRVEYHGGLSSTISSQRTGVADHSSCAERDRIYSNNRFSEVRNNIVAKNMVVSGMVGAGIKVIDNLATRVDWEYCNSKLSQGKSKAGFHFGHFEDKDFQMPEIQAQNLVGRHDRMLQVDADAGIMDKLDNKLETFGYQYNHVNAATRHDSSESESDGGRKPFVNDLVVHSIATPQEIHPLLDTEDLLLHNLNLWLENLLARRKVQRNFSMISERNLIDLDFSDLPFQVAPISTNRVNPFDTPGDTNPHDNVPPIPGSAPSIALRRKNPFDSPSTSPKRADNPIEECPEEESMETDLKNAVFHTNASSSTDYIRIEDVLEPKYMERGEKEASLRRYGSFNLGYDFMVDASGSGQDLLEVDRRNAVFSRHESFSVRPAFSSIFTREKPNRRQWRPIFVPKQLAREEVMHPSLERQSSQDSGSAVSQISDSESFSSGEDYEHIGSNEEESSTSELHQNGEETITADHFPSDSESESEYSEAVEDDENEHLAVTVSVNADNEYQKTLASGENFDTASSTSMSSKEDDGSSNGRQFQDVEVDESVFSPKAPLDESDIKYMSTEEDHKEIEPIYDESPSAIVKNRAFSSTSAQI
ncbi:hypothetical protein Cgig2_020605 [Carnegiea gigantea]|uniref:Uncharacterized protein n=1 Tax=Carnegiea gigantea TaxID=171969 RepID=A0A9Q1Q984_9CARY|nr:hypothetical protein Cgig2_020605 [Carnegiea gigantea]